MDPAILTVWTPVLPGFGIAAIWWSREWYQSKPKFDMPFEAGISHRLTHKTRKEHSIEEDDGSYWNLRVDSRDLYKIWPKTSQP